MDTRSPVRKMQLLLLTIFALVAHSEEAVAGIAENVLEAQLSNGLKVILLENPKSPMATFQVWYRVGSRNEQWGKTGITHLIEHMMFKGTEKVSGKEFTRIVQENGGNFNAFTSYDFTAYFEELSAERLQILLELESDRMQNLQFRDEEFRTERMVVMEERRMRMEDNPQAQLLEQLMAAAFTTQPYHWPIIGWMDDLARIAIDDLREYHKTYYSPNNAFIVAVGDFKKEELLSAIEKAFGSIPKGLSPPRYSYKDPPQLGERRILVQRESQSPYAAMAFHVPNLKDPDSYVLDVIATVLSGGKSSRLYERLVRKEQLALSADAQNSLVSVDPSLFYITAELLPGKEDFAAVERIIDEELERLRKEPVADRELQKAKNQLESAFIFQQDSLFVQAMVLAQYETAHHWKAVDDYIPAIRNVSAQDIQRVARKFLTSSNRTLGILKPTQGKGTGEDMAPKVEENNNGKAGESS